MFFHKSIDKITEFNKNYIKIHVNHALGVVFTLLQFYIIYINIFFKLI